MSARGLGRAVAASVLLHGVAAVAATAVWDRSRVGVDVPEELSIAVEVVWAAPEPPPKVPRPALAPTPSAASLTALVTITADRISSSLSPRAATVERLLVPVAAADVAPLARKSLNPVGPGNSLLAVVAPTVRSAAAPHPPAALNAAASSTALTAAAFSAVLTAAIHSADAKPVSAEEPTATLAIAAGSGKLAVAIDPGPSWVPASRGNVEPEYPLLARRRGFEGRTLLKVEVLASGGSGNVDVISSSGHAILDNAALNAVRQWKFVPAAGARAAAMSIEVPVSFRLVD